ncbi:MAG: PH domain-containing protein [Opitutales bacterium]|jgi:hypothetical protein
MGLIGMITGNAGVVDASKLTETYQQLLVEGEQIEIGFSVVRDTFLFTNRRLILVDIQGLTGKKTEYLSIPFSKITKFSIETSGNFDLDAELKIWVGSDPTPITKQFNKKVNIYQLQQVLAQCTL